jgi:hypothetical protein
MVPRPTFKQMAGAIPRPQIASPGTVRFSFKYAQVPGADPYAVGTREGRYFVKVLERLVSVSGMAADDFAGKKSKELRNHPVDFNDRRVGVKGFTCLNAVMREQADPKAFQFSVSANEHGRIVGFLIGDVFFVVWFDPDHKTYEQP